MSPSLVARCLALTALGACYDTTRGAFSFDLDYGGNLASVDDACDLWVHTGDFQQPANMLVQSNSERTTAGHHVKLRLYQSAVAFPGAYELVADEVEAEFCDLDGCVPFTSGTIVISAIAWDPDGALVGTFDLERVADTEIPALRATGEMSCEVTVWY